MWSTASGFTVSCYAVVASSSAARDHVQNCLFEHFLGCLGAAAICLLMLEARILGDKCDAHQHYLVDTLEIWSCAHVLTPAIRYEE